MNELALFAGAGGGILAGQLLGWRCVCAVEHDAYAASVLVARQNDGCLEAFPVWDDVRTFDGRAWRGVVDVVSGGFPCQDISCAGKGAGIGGERSGLWGEMARIIGEVRPRFVFVENSPLLVSRGLGLVLLDLARLGYAARWGVVGADDAGAPHRRKRVWILGYTNSNGKSTLSINAKVAELQGDLPYADSGRCEQRDAGQRTVSIADADGAAVANAVRVGRCGRNDSREDAENADARSEGIGTGENGGWWSVEPDVGGASHGLA